MLWTPHVCVISFFYRFDKCARWILAYCDSLPKCLFFFKNSLCASGITTLLDKGVVSFGSEVHVCPKVVRSAPSVKTMELIC